MSRVNYIISAHKNPDQLARLIARLNDDNIYFYIHIDAKMDVEPFKCKISGTNIIFIEHRINCLWGDFSMVEVCLLLMKLVISQTREDEMIVLLSGQDYPIKNSKLINNFIRINSNYNFIDTIPVETLWPTTYKEKIESYKFNMSDQRGHTLTFKKISKSSVKSYLRGDLSLKQLLLLLKKRRYKGNLKFYGGSAWWALNGYTCSRLLAYVDENYNDLIDYFQYTTCPDEIFFQSIVMYISQKDSKIMLKPGFTYVDWKNSGTNASPRILIKNDLESLKRHADEFLFARKFDAEVDVDILNKLDLL
jgi:hypothetical protein